MKEILNHHKYPQVTEHEGVWGIECEHKDNGSSSFTGYSSKQDAQKALDFARFCQYAGIPLLVTRKIMSKKG